MARQRHTVVTGMERTGCRAVLVNQCVKWLVVWLGEWWDLCVKMVGGKWLCWLGKALAAWRVWLFFFFFHRCNWLGWVMFCGMVLSVFSFSFL